VTERKKTSIRKNDKQQHRRFNEMAAVISKLKSCHQTTWRSIFRTKVFRSNKDFRTKFVSNNVETKIGMAGKLWVWPEVDSKTIPAKKGVANMTCFSSLYKLTI